MPRRLFPRSLPTSRRRAHRFLTGAAVLGAAALLLAGCTASHPAQKADSATHSEVRPASPAASATATPTTPPVSATPTATTPAAAPVTPLRVGCTTMLTAGQLYSFNPNLVPGSGSATSDPLTNQAAGLGGSACVWEYESSGDSVRFAIALPSAGALASLQASAAKTEKPTSAYGPASAVQGYFARTGSAGRLQVFAHGRWLVGSSATFFEPDDAAPLVRDILGNLKLG